MALPPRGTNSAAEVLLENQIMADTLQNDDGKPSDNMSRGEERDSEPKSPPQVTAEEVKQDAEAEDRFEASDN
jgi:hypothetical protein